MKRFCIIVLLTVFSCASVGSQPRITRTLRDGWKFSTGNPDNASSPNLDDKSWLSVMVPHDWAITGPWQPDGDGNTGKLPWKGEGWYRISLDIPARDAGKTFYLVFDGVMSSPSVFVNGQIAGGWDYGYNSFYLDVSQYLQPGKPNLLAIHADTRDHDSRWYPGAGIFRKVQLLTVDPVHTAIWGIQVSTPLVKPGYADVQIATTLNNRKSAPESVRLTISILNPAQVEIASKEFMVEVPPVGVYQQDVTFTLTDPVRWDISHPALYEVRVAIHRGADVVDETRSPFGVRTIEFTADRGFQLNDRRVQLKGVCLHHDLGPLGAAFNVRAMERQLEIMRGMGVNAIRTSHNVPAPELLDLCDRMGLLVIDEIFDKYDKKADITDQTDFEAFARRNVSNWVMRDRNHPSIILWSVGNEIGDVQYNINGGFRKLQTMVNYVRKYDPERPVTLVCDNQPSASLRHFDYYDVHSWNYGRRYALARQLEPNKAVVISESASTVSTRGFYELPLPEKKTDFTKSLQVSSYDLNAPYWAEIPDDDFMWQEEEAYVAGEFVWTGFDYLGEPTPYGNYEVKQMGLTDRDAARSSYFGIVDLSGIPKDRYYLYKSHWKPEETTVHILPHWNWPAKTGKVPVMVYTNGDCAELFLNGKSLGQQCKNPKSMKSTERYRLTWMDVVYEPGELKAVAYKEGKKIGEQVVRTADDPAALRLTADRKTIRGDGDDLAYITVDVLDKNGNTCPLAELALTVSIAGPGKVMAVDNGNPQSLEPFQGNRVKTFNGKAMVIISGSGQGDCTVTVEGRGVSKGTVKISMQP